MELKTLLTPNHAVSVSATAINPSPRGGDPHRDLSPRRALHTSNEHTNRMDTLVSRLQVLALYSLCRVRALARYPRRLEP